MLQDRIVNVAKSLGLESLPETEEGLRKEIRTEMKALHPDKNDGEFADPESRERFVQLSDALAQLDGGGGSTSLVPVATVAPMVSAIIDALGENGRLSRDESPSQKRNAVMAEARAEASHRFRLSRIGSGAIATLVSAVWLLPTVIAGFGSSAAEAAFQASFVAPLFGHPLFEPIGFGLALYSWMFFGLTWFMEQNDLERIDQITTDEYRELLLHRAVLQSRQQGHPDTVARSDFREALDRRLRPALILRLLGARDVSASFLDRVVGYHVSELVAQRVLTPVDEVSLSPRYTLDEGVSKGITP